eukprot:TRINITY_DN6006_c0_g1_i1.p1 TRINITY_DN6006_c0_g1~~TRINITY_DN6006_c0_g1_i1.p1  ORF type:complete len:139 (-),score=12.91 TRINITY_DN6006_c0_g1_i1:118-534(-)
MQMARTAFYSTKLFSQASFQGFRGFSSAAVKASGEETKVKAVKKNERTNLFEVAKRLPNWGLGCTVAKRHWPSGHCYKITAIKIFRSGRHGRAWGVFCKNGSKRKSGEQLIGGGNKHVWKFSPSAKKPVKDSQVEVIF